MIHNAGSLNIDDVFRTVHIVRPGETIPSLALESFAGGKGVNQSVALARAGASVRHVGRIGEDGIFLKEGLAADGVDVSGIFIGETPTGRAIIQVADDGENAIVLFGGANQTWGTSDVDRLLSAVSPGDVLLLQNEINGIEGLIRGASDSGLRLAMNPAPMSGEVVNYSLERLSWLVVNEIEGRELSGLGETGNEEDVVVELRRRYPNTVVVMTLGKKGAIRADDEGLFRTSFPDQGPIVDTTGAGDTFMGYFLAAEVAGFSREEGLKRACAAGALAVTRAGATTGIPFSTDVDALLLL